MENRVNPETKLQHEILIAINTYQGLCGLRAYRVNNQGTYDVKRGCYRKPGQFSAKGIADIVVIGTGGRVVFLEVKTPTGTPSESQLEFKTQCDKCSVIYEFVRSKQEALSVLRNCNVIFHRIDNTGSINNENNK